LSPNSAHPPHVARTSRTSTPRLPTPWHYQSVRSPGHCHGIGNRQVLATPSSGRVPQILSEDRSCRPRRSGCPSALRQLRYPSDQGDSDVVLVSPSLHSPHHSHDQLPYEP